MPLVKTCHNFDIMFIDGATLSMCGKAELLQEGIFFLIHLFAKDVLVMKKLEIEKTKPIFIISTFKTVTI